MTKQQAISLKLAHWLAGPSILGTTCFHNGNVYKEDQPFNPFASTTEGRAQFAWCVIKAADEPRQAVVEALAKALIESKTNTQAEALEAIYYATGGMPLAAEDI